jgi:hypothetical protein
MLRGSPPRRRSLARFALLPAVLLALPACTGSGGLARGKPTVVTLEDVRHDPPRTIGIVSENHPGVQRNDSALRRTGYKKAPTEAVDALLDRLESQGLLTYGVHVTELAPLDPTKHISRITVSADDQIVQFVVARRPTREAAECYSSMARSVTEMFNGIVDLRPAKMEADDETFLDVQHKLFESNRDKLRAQAKPGNLP